MGRIVAEAVRNWITAVGAKTAYIKPGSPWENCYIESFNARCKLKTSYELTIKLDQSGGADH